MKAEITNRDTLSTLQIEEKEELQMLWEGVKLEKRKKRQKREKHMERSS